MLGFSHFASRALFVDLIRSSRIHSSWLRSKDSIWIPGKGRLFYG